MRLAVRRFLYNLWLHEREQGNWGWVSMLGGFGVGRRLREICLNLITMVVITHTFHGFTEVRLLST